MVTSLGANYNFNSIPKYQTATSPNTNPSPFPAPQLGTTQTPQQPDNFITMLYNLLSSFMAQLPQGANAGAKLEAAPNATAPDATAQHNANPTAANDANATNAAVLNKDAKAEAKAGDETKDAKKEAKGGKDPYEVNIDGEKYVFVQDANNDGITNDKNEILGINDTKNNLFAGMKGLDKNGDGNVSADELKASNTKLMKVGADGKLSNQQYSTDNINGINLNSFKNTNNTGELGIFGSFTVNLANGGTANGAETFENEAYFQKLFGQNAVQKEV